LIFTFSLRFAPPVPAKLPLPDRPKTSDELRRPDGPSDGRRLNSWLRKPKSEPTLRLLASVRVRELSAVKSALSARLMATVTMSPIREARWSLKKLLEPCRQMEFAVAAC